MKKLILALTAVLTMGMTSLGFASPASDLLAQEESTAAKVVDLLQGKGQLTELTPSFTKELSKNFTAQALTNMQKGVTTQLGRMSDVKLARLDKFTDADRLTYLGKAQKAPNVQLTFVFVTSGKKALLQGVNVLPVEVKETPAAQQNTAKK